MPGTISTVSSLGLGYQTGYFAGTLGAPIDQTFFNNAYSGLLNLNKIYKEVYNCDIVGQCTMSTWLEEFGGVSYDCHPNYTNLEYNGFRHQIRSNTTVVVPTRAGGTQDIVLSTKDHFVGGQYVLPQVGNTIVLTPLGMLAEVTAVTHATAFDTIITVRQRSTTAAAQTVTAGDEMLVLQGSILTDCLCPTGQFNFRDLPIEIDLSMIDFALKGELCGDAIEKCQFLKIPFLDENGKEISEMSPWYTTAQQDMYRDFEMRKHYEKLLNPNFGIIPNLRARGIKFTPASSSAITTDDIRDWKSALNLAGISGMEYAVFAGREIFSQFQRMLLTAGVVQLDNAIQPLNDCKWINMEYCGIRVEGMILHIYDECTFSNGKLLGAAGMIFPTSAIFVPMGDRKKDPVRSTPPSTRMTMGNGYNTKHFETVYFRSIQGRRYDAYTDSNGFLNGPGGRNTFGTGCKNHEWSVEARMVLETHCMNSWGYIGLT